MKYTPDFARKKTQSISLTIILYDLHAELKYFRYMRLNKIEIDFISFFLLFLIRLLENVTLHMPIAL